LSQDTAPGTKRWSQEKFPSQDAVQSLRMAACIYLPRPFRLSGSSTLERFGSFERRAAYYYMRLRLTNLCSNRLVRSPISCISERPRMSRKYGIHTPVVASFCAASFVTA